LIPRGQKVTQLVTALWKQLAIASEDAVKTKLAEKRAQVMRRVEFTRQLRENAVQCILLAESRYGVVFSK
jgi:hypothetical protein